MYFVLHSSSKEATGKKMLLRKSYEKNPFTAFIEKKSTSKWTFVVQTYVVQGSAVLRPPLHCLPCPPRRTPPTPTSMLKGDYRGFHGLFAPFWLNKCLYGLVQAGAVREVCKKLQTPILLPHHTGQRPNSCPPCQAHTMPTSSHQTAKSSRSPQYLAQSRVLTKYVWSAQDRGHTNEPCAGHQNGFQHQPL